MEDNFSIKITPHIDFKDSKILHIESAIKETESKIKKIRQSIKNSIYSDNLKTITPQIALKNQKTKLSSLKANLAKENKAEVLKEKVEKYRMSETKRLMREGFEYEKARKEAFRKSLISDRDKRKLEYRALKEKGIAVSKFSKLLESIKKNTSLKVQSIGVALGNVTSSMFSNVINFAKRRSLEEFTKRTNYHLSSLSYSEKEIKGINHKLSKLKNFSELQQSDFIRKSIVLKSDLSQLETKDKESFLMAVELAAKLKSSGIFSSNDEAISAVSEVLKANPDAMFFKFRTFLSNKEDFASKYGEYALEEYKNRAMFSTKSRIELVKQFLKDIPAKALYFSSIAEKSEDVLKKAEDKAGLLVSKGLDYLAPKIEKVLDFITKFDLKRDLVNPFFDGFKIIIYTLLKPIESLLNIIGLKVDFSSTFTSREDESTKRP